MARGRKKSLSLEEQLEQTNTEISETEEKLKELRAKRKQLEADIKVKEQSDLLSIIQESGKSIEEIKVLLFDQ